MILNVKHRIYIKIQEEPNPSHPSPPRQEKSRKSTIFLEFLGFKENHKKSHFSLLLIIEENQEKPRF